MPNSKDSDLIMGMVDRRLKYHVRSINIRHHTEPGPGEMFQASKTICLVVIVTGLVETFGIQK